jgi:hypothetical protein
METSGVWCCGDRNFRRQQPVLGGGRSGSVDIRDSPVIDDVKMISMKATLFK